MYESTRATKFTIYEASTGRILVTSINERQAGNIAGAMRVYNGMHVNVGPQAPGDIHGGNVHDYDVRYDRV